MPRQNVRQKTPRTYGSQQLEFAKVTSHTCQQLLIPFVFYPVNWGLTPSTAPFKYEVNAASQA